MLMTRRPDFGVFEKGRGFLVWIRYPRGVPYTFIEIPMRGI
jgi:hypothetical protein